MTAINTANNVNNNAINNTTSTSTPSKGLNIDTDGFMTMFISALNNQDPMEPMDNSEIMQQMSQLISIQNTTQLSEIVQELSETVKGQNPITSFLDLMGNTVKVDNGDGTYNQGTVLSVGNDNGKVLIELEDGSTYAASSIVGATTY